MGKGTERIQRNLNREGFGPLDVDGNRGPKTREALRRWAERAHAYPQGIDVSAYQPVIDWAAVKAAGVSFVAIRAGVSLSSDSLFASHWSGAKAAGLLRAAYWFFAPWQDPVAQARRMFARLGGDTMAADYGELPPVLDVEALAPKAKPGQPPPVPVTTAQLVTRTRLALEVLAQLTGRKPILYTYASFAYEHKLGVAFPGYKLWLADYREGPPELLGGFTSYQFHQYAGDTGRQVGVKGPCDLDYFRGTLEELKSL